MTQNCIESYSDNKVIISYSNISNAIILKHHERTIYYTSLNASLWTFNR